MKCCFPSADIFNDGVAFSEGGPATAGKPSCSPCGADGAAPSNRIRGGERVGRPVIRERVGAKGFAFKALLRQK